MLRIGTIFAIGALGYGGLEILWRGNTHWTMLLAGGCGLLALCRISRCRAPFPALCALGSAAITGIEFAFGLCCNRLFHMHVWDYSGLWGNVCGQICPLYTFLWFLLCVPVLGLLRGAQGATAPFSE